MSRSLLSVFAVLLIFPRIVSAECNCTENSAQWDNPDIVFVGRVLDCVDHYQGWAYGGCVFEVEEFVKAPETVDVFESGRNPAWSAEWCLPKDYAACGFVKASSPFSSTRVVIDSLVLSDACSLKFETDKRYAVRALRMPLETGNVKVWRKGDMAERWWTNSCSGTTLLGSSE